MYKQIKQLADEAVALQNKDRMDAALREISGIAWAEAMKTCFEDKREGRESALDMASIPSGQESLASTKAKPGDSVQITSFPFDRQPAESLPVAPLVTKIFDAAVADAQPGDTLKIVRYGDPESSGPVVLATSTKPSKTGESQVLSAKVTPAKVKKGGAK